MLKYFSCVTLKISCIKMTRIAEKKNNKNGKKTRTKCVRQHKNQQQ